MAVTPRIAWITRLLDYPAYAFLESQSYLRHLLPVSLKTSLAGGSLDPKLKNITLRQFLTQAELDHPHSTDQFCEETAKTFNRDSHTTTAVDFQRPLEDTKVVTYLENKSIRHYFQDQLSLASKQNIDRLIDELAEYWPINISAFKDYLSSSWSKWKIVSVNLLVTEINKIFKLTVGVFLEALAKASPRLRIAFYSLCVTQRTLMTQQYSVSPLVPTAHWINSASFFNLYYKEAGDLIPVEFVPKKDRPVYMFKVNLEVFVYDLLNHTKNPTKKDGLYSLVLHINSLFTSLDPVDETKINLDLIHVPAVLYLSDERLHTRLDKILTKTWSVDKYQTRASWFNFLSHFITFIPINISPIIESLVLLPQEKQAEAVSQLLSCYSGITIGLLIKAIRQIPGYEADQTFIEICLQIREELKKSNKISDSLDDNSCVICLDLPRTHIAVSCGHYVYCEVCIKQRTTCVICRQPIKEKMKVFFN